jgi:hypothetical protein
MKLIPELVHDDSLRAVLLVVVGFVLGQFNNYVTTRRERKKAISAALADLLEVRHQYVGVDVTINELAKLGNMPEHLKSQLRSLLDTFLPSWDELHARYEESVTLLSGLDPLLAFELRSKDLLRPVTVKMHSLMGGDPVAASFVAPFLRSAFADKVEPAFNASIRKLARSKGWVCWYQTCKTLKRRDGLPDDLKRLFEPVKGILEMHIKTAVSSGQPITNTVPTTPPPSGTVSRQPEKQ